jgi:hypothetical protein
VLRREGAEGIIVVKTKASYQPELIDSMKIALDDAANTPPAARLTSTMKAKFASRIVSVAARGVRDPIQLRLAALMEIEDELHRCYAQLRRLRQQVAKAELTDSRRNSPLHRGTTRVTARARSRIPPSDPIKRADPSGLVCEICGWACEDQCPITIGWRTCVHLQ